MGKMPGTFAVGGMLWERPLLQTNSHLYPGWLRQMMGGMRGRKRPWLHTANFRKGRVGFGDVTGAWPVRTRVLLWRDKGEIGGGLGNGRFYIWCFRGVYTEDFLHIPSWGSSANSDIICLMKFVNRRSSGRFVWGFRVVWWRTALGSKNNEERIPSWRKESVTNWKNWSFLYLVLVSGTGIVFTAF